MSNEMVLHFDGPITIDHKVTLRTLGNTLLHLQSAVDRAYIDERYKRLRKHARLKKADYVDVDFILEYPTSGGFIQLLRSLSAYPIVDRINNALAPAYEEAISGGLQETHNLLHQASQRKLAIASNTIDVVGRNQLVEKFNSDDSERKFADRSINKEIDQILRPLELERFHGSTLDFTLGTTKGSRSYHFNEDIVKSFHKVVAERTLGEPVSLLVKIRAMDAGSGNARPNGKATDIHTNKDFVLDFIENEDFNLVAPYVKAGEKPTLRIVAAPVLEYGTFDPISGNMMFLKFVGVEPN